ncbi:porin [Tropicimonas sp. IMCC6043]|uniref:porin n=1 Tax=Tropicimonas sp. IMCC6043 TaxID=2510645 RepID=UPI00101CDD65|nr:porin [Tropicimonas sp. IMCC6043]RYH10308.1 porin [Tropicimonas sp. IMCC6043]
MTRSTTLLASSLLAALAVPAVGEELKYANDTGGSVTFHGQLSPAYLSFDDGVKTYDNLVDNAHSNSRVGFNLDQVFNNGSRLRFKFEAALGAPQSSNFSQDVEPIWEWDKTDIRKAEMIYSGNFGTIYIGQGSMATDGVGKHDLSGTTMASSVTTNDTAGSYFWRLSDGTLSDIALKNVYSNFDGSRKGRIRYDTPDWNGLVFAASYGTDILQDYGDTDYWDVAMYYSAEIGDMEYAAGLGYGWSQPSGGGDTSERWAGSFSALHRPTGLNGTLATGAQIDGGSYVYGKAGWIADLWSGGASAFSVDYYGGNDFVTDGSTSTQWGVQAEQYFDDWNLEAYVGYAAYSFEDDVARYKDASSLLAGLRWSF